MKNKHLIVILALSGFCCNAHSQENCTVPLAPVLKSVSVEPETDKTDFTWILSESPDIAAYIIYSYKDGDGKALDTVWNPTATGHTITNTAPKYSSVSYVIAAHRLSAVAGLPGCTSPLSNSLSTIFCRAVIDTCINRINVSWNSYASQPMAVIDYSIMLSVNGGDFTEAGRVAPETVSYTLDNFITGAEYSFFIRANLEEGFSSTSNKASLSTKMLRPPAWINADWATVDAGNRVMLSFTIDPASEISDFILERKTGLSGTFLEIARLRPVNGTVLFTDTKSDAGKVNYYRLSAINSCDIPVTFSNISSNMVLSAEWEGDDLRLSWNKYREWSGAVSGYRVFVNTGSGFYEKASVIAADSVYLLGYKDIMYNVSGDEVCFYIDASETGNPHGIAGQSSSSVKCTAPVELITVPNLFTPDNDLVNDLFRPVLSFRPKDYHLIISDQHGSLLFETRDFNSSWDGTRNGQALPDGVCLWFLKVTTPSGKNISRTGTVTILRRH
jgi:gliding motility-associated-like protein